MVAANAPGDEGYERRKDREAARQRQQSHLANDVLPFPEVADLDLVERCRTDLELFLQSFFPRTFRLPFSADHRKSIGKCQQSAIEGGLFAWAAPRGTGKTAIAQGTALWATIYGWRRYVPIIGPDAGHANRMLKNIKAELRFNDDLAAGFPRVCHPIKMLGGKAIRAGNQHAGGKETRIVWSDGKLVLPTVEGSPASGAIMVATGITGQIRGMSEVSSDGALVRPDFFIIDDFQTAESAHSASQCETRLAVIQSDIAELAGPGVEVCGIILCTVIRKGDAADQLLDRKLHPEFRGERMKAMYSLPKNQEWWQGYGEILRKGLEEDESTAKANAHYSNNRSIADEGAVVAWPERFKSTEISAIQSLMNVKILKPDVFAAEYQNEPRDFSLTDLNQLSPSLVANKTNGIPRGIAPGGATKVTVGIDVQKSALYYAVAAWEDDFTGATIEYGTWPEQTRRNFQLHQLNPTLQTIYPDRPDLDGQIFAGLTDLTAKLLAREWDREGDSGFLRPARCLIDGNWPEVIDVVYEFCRRSPNASVLMPSRGAYYGARSKQGITDHKKRKGEKLGVQWVIPTTTKRNVTHVRWDTNYWKTFLHARLAIPVGSRTAMTLYGANPEDHRMFAEHLCAESRVEVKGPEKTVMEWTQDPAKENHYLDALLMATVAASVEGIKLSESHGGKAEKPRRRMTLAEMKAAANR